MRPYGNLRCRYCGDVLVWKERHVCIPALPAGLPQERRNGAEGTSGADERQNALQGVYFVDVTGDGTYYRDGYSDAVDAERIARKASDVRQPPYRAALTVERRWWMTDRYWQRKTSDLASVARGVDARVEITDQRMTVLVKSWRPLSPSASPQVDADKA